MLDPDSVEPEPVSVSDRRDERFSNHSGVGDSVADSPQVARTRMMGPRLRIAARRRNARRVIAFAPNGYSPGRASALVSK